MSGCAWVTLATNDTYCLGALVLAHSLKKVSTRHQLAIIITPQVSLSMREQLLKVFDVIHLVDVLDSQDAANLALLQRPDLGITFTKIHCWNLIQYSKCVFLDADTLVIQNCDELMEREELSAAPDPGWPDCFNSGVFVFVPSQDTFKQLLQFASTHGSFDGGDQGLLNMYFNDWPTNDIRKHLSFLYNMCSTSTYTYLPALQYYGANIKIVHFIGVNKPWLLGPSGSGLTTFTQAWWDIFKSSVVQHLSKNMSGLAGALGSKEKSAIEEQWRKQNWEQGNIDYTGKDSFENIWHKIMEAVNKPKSEESKPNRGVPKETAPKEIASQAIPEKEKADIPAVSGKHDERTQAPLKDSTNIQPQVAPSAESPKESKNIIPPLASFPPLEKQQEPPKPETGAAVAPSLPPQSLTSSDPTSILGESNLDQVGDLPKIEDILKGLEQHLLLEEQKLIQLPADILKTPISDSPVLPEKPKAEDGKGQVPASPIQPDASQIPKTPEATKLESPKNQVPLLPETPKTPEAVKPAVAQTQEPAKPEPPKTPPAPIQDIAKATEPPKSEAPAPKLSEVPKSETPKSPETTSVEPPKIPEAPKPELPKTPDASLPEPPKIPEVPKSESPKTPEAPKPESVKIPDAPKPEAQKTSAPPKQEAQKTSQSNKKGSQKTPAPPKPEAPKTQAPPKPEVPKTPEMPKLDLQKTSDTSKPNSPKIPDAPKPEPPKIPDAPKPEPPKTPDAPKQEAPKTPDAPKQEAPKTPDAPKQEAPKTPDAPKQEAPKTPDAPKQEAPKVPLAPLPDLPKTAEAPKSDSPKIPEAPKQEAQKMSEEPKLPDASKPEAPKSPEVMLKQDVPVLSEAPKTESTKPQSESQKPTPNNGSSQAISQPQIPVEASNAPVSLSSILDAVETKDQKQQQSQPSTGKQQSPPTNGSKKQKTPPKEGQKPQKQQAPQPPPKNGKGKKGQHPEPTTAHPLAETPVLPGAGDQQVVAVEPITPPTSPETAPKLPEPQPATPTITAPTPPISPLEVSKVEDPLTTQLKTEEVKAGSASGPTEAPVPPKRKGKGNEKHQPQKNQNGGKGKGKK